jgi:uncharacterized protein (DUF305 family)
MWRVRSIVFLCASLGACATRGRVAPPAHANEAAFLEENEAAMAKMMKDMMVKPSGDVDRDFVAMMAPHHLGAIEMARALLRYGKNEALRRLAQEIIVTQQEEIAAMHLALGQPLPETQPAPTQVGSVGIER